MQKRDLFDRIEKMNGSEKLIGWQFAADGEWDKAQRVSYEDISDQAGRIRAWLGDLQTNDMAFEALFETSAGEQFFFGVRLAHLAADKKSAVVNKLMFQNKRNENLKEVIAKTHAILGSEKVFAGHPDHLEVGVFDIWNKVKSLVVWKNGDAKIVLPEDIHTRAKTADLGFNKLYEPQPNPIMMEVVWNKNNDDPDSYPCWVSLPVSELRKTDKKFIISKERYLTVAKVFLGYNLATER